MILNGLGFISFKGQDLIKWGANYRPSTIDGEWWRLLSSVFLHGGLMHLLFNMYGLLFVGIFVEPVLGKTKFLISYLEFISMDWRGAGPRYSGYKHFRMMLTL